MLCRQRNDPFALGVEERFAYHDKPASFQFRKSSESIIEVFLGTGVEHADLNSKSIRRRFRLPAINLGGWIRWVHEIGKDASRGHQLVQQLHVFSADARNDMLMPVRFRPVD